MSILGFPFSGTVMGGRCFDLRHLSLWVFYYLIPRWWKGWQAIAQEGLSFWLAI